MRRVATAVENRSLYMLEGRLLWAAGFGRCDNYPCESCLCVVGVSVTAGDSMTIGGDGDGDGASRHQLLECF